jgi:hypothetical protein
MAELPPSELAEHISLARRGIEAVKANCIEGKTTGCEGHPWVETGHHAALSMRIYQCDAGSGAPRRHKAVIAIPFSARQVLDVILDDPVRLTWDKAVAKLVSQPIADRVWLQYGITKGVFGVSPRDFVNVVTMEDLEGGGLVHGGAGIEEHALFPHQPRVLRALNMCGVGWHLVPIPSPDGSAQPWTRVSYVIQSDLRGWLPHFVINSAMSSTYAGFFEGVIKELKHRHDGQAPRPA